MGSTISFFFKSLFVIGMLISLANSNTTISLLEKQIKSQEDYIATSQSNMMLALEIISTSQIWYIVNKDTISSEPNSQGTVIRLDTPLRTLGSSMVTRRVENNAKILFVNKASVLYSEGYTVCGGILSYDIYSTN